MKNIGIVNHVEIVYIDKPNGKLVPIQPLCKAMGIKEAAQQLEIEKHKVLSSVSVVECKMLCIPHLWVFGWLFNIDPKNIEPSAKDTFERYNEQCYHLLFDYFVNAVQLETEHLRQEMGIMEDILSLSDREKNLKSEIGNKQRILSELRKDRIPNK